MILFKRAAEIHDFLLQNKKNGKTIAFVPTMGALHQGHLSLIQTAQKADKLVVCSIFINPAQFNDIKDFDNYPKTVEQDINLLEMQHCDVLFLPSVSEMYANGIHPAEHYPLGYLETVLEGQYRPGHFQGVCLIIDKLLNIIPADDMYLGQKDYQQCMVIKKLLELKNINTNIQICTTLREKDGLAMSSRNMRLSEWERKQASKIFEALTEIKKQIKPGNLALIKQRAVDFLTSAQFRVDYIEIADATNLQLIDHWDGKQKLVVLAAAFLGQVRLIDNLVL